MEFEWDEHKRQQNIAKHGVDFAIARQLFSTEITIIPDDRISKDYGEDRWIAGGLIGEQFYICVFTLRSEVVRVISMRRGNRREKNRFGFDQ